MTQIVMKVAGTGVQQAPSGLPDLSEESSQNQKNEV